jgi:MFS superfamily sulfate permease-like transporter
MTATELTRRFLPFLTWIGELRSPSTLRADLLAGITVALVLIPQSMAYAQLAGLPSYYGLYAAFLPPVVAALLGSSRQLATGPVAVVSLMSASALEPIAASGTDGYIAYAILLALMVGSFQLSLGLLRLGVLVNFISHPVVLGFTSAAAIIIATSQLDKIFGVHGEKAEHHYQTVWNTAAAALEQTHVPTLVMAVAAFAIMILVRRLRPRAPNVLIAVVLTTLASWGLGYSQLRPVHRDQVIGETVERILTERQRLSAEITELERQLAEARRALRGLLAEEHVDETMELAARLNIDLLALQRELHLKSLQADTRELMAVHFELVAGPEPDGDRFHVAGHTPAGKMVQSRGWRITELKDPATLVLHRGGKVVGVLPAGLPSLRLPTFDWEVAGQLLMAALTIALIGFMEAIAIAKSMAARTRQQLDPNQELIGQGLGNIVGSLFQSYPTAGSFSRSAVNIDAGARTGFSSAVTSLVVVIVLTWLTPLLYHLPQATLAAVIMMAVIALVRIEPIRYAWRVDRSDGAVIVITFVMSLALAPHLDQGLVIGVLLSLGLFLYRSMRPRVAMLSRHPDGSLLDAEIFGLATCENISVLRFDGSLYFANTGYFEYKVMEKIARKPQLRYMIVDAEGINRIDATGEEMLRQVAERLHTAGIELLFSRMKKQVFDVLERSGFLGLVGRSRFFRRTEQALEYAWSALGEDHKPHCPLAVPTPLPTPPPPQRSP